jgi:hypothetical protein
MRLMYYACDILSLLDDGAVGQRVILDFAVTLNLPYVLFQTGQIDHLLLIDNIL